MTYGLGRGMTLTFTPRSVNSTGVFGDAASRCAINCWSCFASVSFLGND